jgi:hypothetical protein
LKKDKDMNRIIVPLMTAGLILLSHVASAQSNLDPSTAEHDNCHHVSGKLVEIYDASQNTAFGKLTNAGWLDGTTATVDSSTSLPTPDLNKITFSATITLTTAHGQLKGKRVFLFDVVTGFGTDMSDIDGDTSTGIFARATGVLYVNAIRTVTVAQGPYYSVDLAELVKIRGVARNVSRQRSEVRHYSRLPTKGMMREVVSQIGIANHLTSVVDVSGNYVRFTSEIAEVPHRTVLPEQRMKERFVCPVSRRASA